MGNSDLPQAALDYIALLEDASGRLASMAYAHGWRESEDVVKRGKELRAELGLTKPGDENL